MLESSEHLPYTAFVSTKYTAFFCTLCNILCINKYSGTRGEL